ncbi:AmmeMemoRadiSam system protein A [candidate division KSB1 bacterium]|nr:AmmeMemoRadiSam system protein A [candidate division KSB1 bacterium]
MSKFSIEDKKKLLQVAREAIKSKLLNIELTIESFDSETLNECCGAFVTIKKNKQLRGCVGLLTSDLPLPETVARMAESAATMDSRFPPMKIDELDETKLEISVLSPLKTISDTKEIVVGLHGLYISSGGRHGLLLPQVAVENKWDENSFLEHTCLKACLSAHAWKDSKTTIQIFSAEIFGDKNG